MRFTDEQLQRLDRIMREVPSHRTPATPTDAAPTPDLPERPDPRNMGGHEPGAAWPYEQLGGSNTATNDPTRKDRS